jgi:hypothetical protein
MQTVSGAFISSGREATSSAVSNRLSLSACFGWIPDFEPVSANLFKPL